MKGKTGELLYFLLWSADKLARPTFRNLTDSFESWSYRNGLSYQLARLEKRGLVERDRSGADNRLYRLTQSGRICALGGRDPVACWSRPWDGQWRLFIFDIPTSRNLYRDRLRKHLRAVGFGVLQGSVWVSPDLHRDEIELLKNGKIDVNSLVVLEARPCSGETDHEIVKGAWDFEEIQCKYSAYLKMLERCPRTSVLDKEAAAALHLWASEERLCWKEVVEIDPFLPKQLLPSGYLGCEAWRRRVEVLTTARKHLQNFKPNCP